MERPTCKTCPYFVPDTDDQGYTGSGECKRHAPSPILAGIKLNQSTYADWFGDFIAEWPWVFTDEVGIGRVDWCGEHPDFPEYIKSLK